jgi:subtilisin family serine protease
MTRMRRVRSMLCILVTVTLVITSLGPAPTASEADGRYIVIYADGISPVLSPALSLLGVKVIHVLSLINALAIQIPLSLVVGDIVELLLSDPNVAGVFDDPLGSAAEVAPLTSAQSTAKVFDWGMDRIKAPEAQQEVDGTPKAAVTVAVLDTGVDLDHPALKANLIQGVNTLPEGGSPDDNHGHGTHVAGTIAAVANSQATGVCDDCNIASVKVLDANARGRVSDLIKGLQWVNGKSYRVVNMSLAFPDSFPLEQAIAKLYKNGKIMVAAAGNCGTSSSVASTGAGQTSGDGGDEGGGDSGEGSTACDASTGVSYPAGYSGVISVAATTYNNQITSYSRYNPDKLEIDVAAPGGAQGDEQILSTRRGGGFDLRSGTSQAAAHVSGSIALVLQQQSHLKFGEIIGLLQATAVILVDSSTGKAYPPERQGEGLIDVWSMIQALP